MPRNPRLARWRVRCWRALERHAERRLVRANGGCLTATEAGRENSPA